jgi:hypothetical protein
VSDTLDDRLDGNNDEVEVDDDSDEYDNVDDCDETDIGNGGKALEELVKDDIIVEVEAEGDEYLDDCDVTDGNDIVDGGGHLEEADEDNNKPEDEHFVEDKEGRTADEGVGVMGVTDISDLQLMFDIVGVVELPINNGVLVQLHNLRTP